MLKLANLLEIDMVVRFFTVRLISDVMVDSRSRLSLWGG